MLLAKLKIAVTSGLTWNAVERQGKAMKVNDNERGGSDAVLGTRRKSQYQQGGGRRRDRRGPAAGGDSSVVRALAIRPAHPAHEG